MKVLVVEDDPVSLKLNTSVLKKNDYDVVEAISGQEAISLLDEEKDIDIIVSNIMMPVMNGFHLLSYLKADRQLSRIPVILCSTLQDVESVKKAIELGAVDYIVKPIDSDILIDKIKKAEEKVQGAILIVDDEELLRSLLSNILTRDGYKVLLADNGNQALELLENNRVSLLLSDIVMPDMSGLELLTNAKNKYPTLPVFLISGHTKEYTRERALAAKADGFVSKPFKSHEILRSVEIYMR